MVSDSHRGAQAYFGYVAVALAFAGCPRLTVDSAYLEGSSPGRYLAVASDLRRALLMSNFKSQATTEGRNQTRSNEFVQRYR